MRIVFFASTSTSECAAYFRGITRALADRGHRVTFYDAGTAPGAAGATPDASSNAGWARLGEAIEVLREERDADMLVNAVGVGDFGTVIGPEILELKRHDNLVVFWDPDPAQTIERIGAAPDDHVLSRISGYDLVVSRGGSDRIVKAWRRLGARECAVILDAADPAVNHPVPLEPRFACDLALHADCAGEIEPRVQELFLNTALQLPHSSFVLAGRGWGGRVLPPNVRCVGSLGIEDRNALNSSALAVLSVCPERTRRLGFCSMAGMLEAASCGACVIADSWEGLAQFLEPEREVLPAGDALEVANWLHWLTRERARELGTAARRRILAAHTYAHRVERLERLIGAVARV